MPYYERTGMISHRHPFYGYSGRYDTFDLVHPDFSGMVKPARGTYFSSRPHIPGRLHGYGLNPFSTEGGQQPGPWAPDEEQQPDAGSPMPAPPLDQQFPAPPMLVPPAKAGVPLVPLLLLGGAVAIFLLTLKKRG